MTESARTEIFARLRRANQASDATPLEAELTALGSGPAATLPAQELCEAFLINILNNRGTADCARNRAEAVDAVRNFLRDNYRSQRFVAGNDPRLAAMPWRNAGLLPRFGTLEDGEPIALSFARLGIAELGAIVTTTGKANPAPNNLLCEQHIVLVDVVDVVSDMEQAWEKLAPELQRGSRPRGINFIAGPSSTADIEGQLVYGAHGPKGWHVILLGEVPEGALERARARVAGN
ncbi:MAG: L-lactate dehydrogenase complex protein LldG [Bacteroidia bacterium]|jgi:L-lactate dehydrogenase complex protein LldG